MGDCTDEIFEAVCTPIALYSRACRFRYYPGRERYMNHLTERAKQYLLSHFTEIYRMKEISRVLGVSYEYLRKVFVRDMGISLIGYLRAVRVEKTKTLLKDYENKLYTVAREVGYSNEQALIRNFKNITGMTPTEYRRNACNEAQSLQTEKSGVVPLRALTKSQKSIPKLNSKNDN